MITEAMIRRIYPHRVAADPKVCPVCCGDTHTDDRRFGTEVTHTINDGSPTPRPIYRCLACVVWDTTRWPYRISCAKCDEIIQAPCREKMPHSICPHCGEDYHYYEADLAPNGEPWGDVAWDDPA